MKKIAIIGAGYVGLVTGTCLAESGHSVICLDVDEKKINQLQQGVCPYYESRLAKTLNSALQKNTISFTSRYSELTNSDFFPDP